MFKQGEYIYYNGKSVRIVFVLDNNLIVELPSHIHKLINKEEIYEQISII